MIHVRTSRASALALSLGLALPLLLAIGCSELTLPGTDAQTPMSIIIVPATATLALENDQVVTQTFRAFAYYGGSIGGDSGAEAGGPRDQGGEASGPPGTVEITSRVQWSVETQTMGRFQGNTFRTEISEGGQNVPAAHGGKTRVVAKLAGGIGFASVTVSYKKDVIAGAAAADAASKFTGTPRAGVLGVVYPASGVFVPPNLGQLDVQYTKGTATNDLFALTFTSKLLQLRIFTTEASHNLTTKQWQAVGLTSQGEDVSLVVQGTKASAPTVRDVSAAVTIKIAESLIKGGLYYWVVSKAAPGQAQDEEGIYRYDFDKYSTSAEAYYTRKEAQDCVGCHALSRGGAHIGFTKSGGNGNTAIFDVKTRTPVIDSKYRGDIQTFSPDGNEVIVAYKGVLTRRDVKTGNALETIPTGTGKATHPDWSPDGSSLVYVSVADKDYWLSDKGFKIEDDVHFRNGSITLITKSSGSWGTPKVLVKGGATVNYYYPTFSPKGDWILFNRSTGDSYSDVDATIYVVKPDGQGLRALAKLNQAYASNSWPRWSSFVQKYKTSTIYWLTFSSVRDYGVKLLNSKVTKYDDKAPQIWMTAFDATLAAAGADPTPYPAFWVPFQDINHHNHIAQWTEKVVSLQ